VKRKEFNFKIGNKRVSPAAQLAGPQTVDRIVGFDWVQTAIVDKHGQIGWKTAPLF